MVNTRTSFYCNSPENVEYLKSYLAEYSIPNLSTFFNGLFYFAHFGSSPAGDADIGQLLHDIVSGKLAAPSDSREGKIAAADMEGYQAVSKVLFGDGNLSIRSLIPVIRKAGKEYLSNNLIEDYQEVIYNDDGLFLPISEIKVHLNRAFASDEYRAIIKDIEYREFLKKHNLPEPTAEPAAVPAAGGGFTDE